MKTMAEVLAKHQWYDATTDNEDPATGCTGCPEWFGSEDALDDCTFAAHQAIELANAGYGDVRSASSGALRDAAEELARLPYVRPDAEGREEYERLLAIRRGNTDAWLRDRAKALEAS